MKRTIKNLAETIYNKVLENISQNEFGYKDTYDIFDITEDYDVLVYYSYTSSTEVTCNYPDYPDEYKDSLSIHHIYVEELHNVGGDRVLHNATELLNQYLSELI